MIHIVKIYILFQFITRIILSAYCLLKYEICYCDFLAIFIPGILNDIVSICYFLPCLILFSFLFYIIFRKFPTIYFPIGIAFYFLGIIILMILLVSELIFWDEFSTRFNFIAVDYLIYTQEIIGTVKESLPYKRIFLCILSLSVLITWRNKHFLLIQLSQINLIKNTIISVGLILLDLFFFHYYTSDRFIFSLNNYVIELGKNGGYEFCSAFLNNSLDYNKFYNTINPTKALKIVRSSLNKNDNLQYINQNDIVREIKSNDDLKRYNIILITVESLSAEFMSYFGNKNSITPNLDRLIEESIFFTNFYAVGTRTVRGLEAITLSAPPTPGSSIIRRPNNHNMFNIGTIFRRSGYVTNFIFGGYSYFDNLYNYFSSNNYTIVDRSHLRSDEITFSNIWGVADEDILNKALDIADQNYKDKKNFFSLILTTSNHRPYTFTTGRIDLASGSGRNAAVKYTDFAIGRFLELSKLRPWFKDTIFVITADHCASSAGKTNLPIKKYHIPLFIWAPYILKPKIIDNLSSQIDIAPTILGLLNLSYESKFFGQDILNNSANRAFISTYQLLGYIKNNNLVILSPNAEPITYKILENNNIRIKNNFITEEAISFYQTAYNLYINNKMIE